MGNVAILTVRCGSQQHLFGVRMERVSANGWSGTWAFPLKDDVAKREGYATTQLKGEFGFADNYPGCPYCKSKSCFCCTCGKISCWNSDTRKVVCPWCGTTGEVSGVADSVTAGGDR